MLNPRLDNLPEYPFDRLRSLLDPITPRAGIEPLSLSIGEPQHTPPSLITDIITRDPSLWGKYPPGNGTPGFRQACAGWLSRRYQLGDTIQGDRHVLPVAGTREALFLISSLVVPPSKAGGVPLVAMPNPFYHVYGGACAVSGARPLYLNATAENGFMPDIQLVAPETLNQIALYYLCSPSNPQGAIASIESLKTAILLARKHDFVLVVDECYAEIYDKVPPPGALQACLELGGGFENVLVFHSLSKRSSSPGLRSGFVAGDASLIEAFKRLRNYVGPQVPIPIMNAAAALWDDDEHVAHNRELYTQKFDIAERLFTGKFDFFRPAAGFFLWLNVQNGEEATKKLWAEGAMRVLPGSFISRMDLNGINPGDPYIRIALVHDLETTERALSRILSILS